MTSLVLITIGFALILQVFGVTGQDVTTYGWLGAAAAAYASKDIIANIFSSISLHFSKPFSPGETIKVDSYEGEVLRIGLTTTSLLDLATKDEIFISNTEIAATRVIVNQSRAQWRRKLSSTIPLDLNKIPPVKIPLISIDVIDALKWNSQICLAEEIQSCYLCNERPKSNTCSKGEFDFARQQIRLDIAKILKKHDV